VGGLGFGPNPPIPNPQSPIPNPQLILVFLMYRKKIYLLNKNNNLNILRICRKK